VFTEANLNRANLRKADLSHAVLRDANLCNADLTGARASKADFLRAHLEQATLALAVLYEADLRGADLHSANCSGATLCGADLSESDLSRANLRGTDLRNANLIGVRLRGTNLYQADLAGANLSRSLLVDADLREANLTASRIYGISVWNVNLAGAAQPNLIITPPDEPAIQLDNLEVAQFIYLLLKNEKIRQVIDTVSSKVVLILGSFMTERKVILDKIRNELRNRDYLPVLFDFEKPFNRDRTETVSTLAHMARFVIADITDAKSIPQELDRIVPNLPSVPIQPLLLASQNEYGMFEHFRRYPWVLEPFVYQNQDDLVAALDVSVIAPAEVKLSSLRFDKGL
jgi:hypothetical protein